MLTSAIKNTDITVVVQGAISLPDPKNPSKITTEHCISSVREILPGAKIILSTWTGMKTEGLDYDILVENEDPGQNKITHPHHKLRIANDNRQIRSTYEGLKRVKTTFAMKLRSDNYLANDNFKLLFGKFENRHPEYHFLKERVVTCSSFCRELEKGGRTPFQVCDFFYFGLIEDLLDIWNIPFFPRERITNLSKWHYRLSTEQNLWVSFLTKHTNDINCSHLLDESENNIRKSHISIANNLVVAEHSTLGLGIPDRFHLKEKVRCSFISFFRWQTLYQKYCDENYPIKNKFLQTFSLHFNRLKYYGKKITSRKIRTWLRIIPS